MSDREARVALQQTLYASRNPTRRYLHGERRRWIERRIAAMEQCRCALEVGPGSGVYLPALSRTAERVLAVDRDEAHLEGARGATKSCTAPVDVVLADLRSLPFRDGSVDLLLCSEVVEHVSPGPGLLAGLARVLAPDGEMILTTPQPFSPLELLGRIAFLPGIIHLLRCIYREPVEPTGHINLLRRRDLDAAFDEAGLEVVERECLGFYLPVIAEFFGTPGRRFLAQLDRKLRGSSLEGLLWTQCYRLRHRRTTS